MPTYTKEQIMTAYRNLPEDIKEAMFSVETVEILREIGEKHKLMIDKIGELANETGLVMLGLTHPSQYISHLAERLQIDHNQAKEIAEEINTLVFFPIKENLKKIHGIKTPTPEEVGPPAGEARAPTPPVPTKPPEPKPEPKADVGEEFKKTEVSEPVAPLIPPIFPPAISSEKIVPQAPVPEIKPAPTLAEGEVKVPAPPAILSEDIEKKPPMIMSMPADLSQIGKKEELVPPLSENKIPETPVSPGPKEPPAPSAPPPEKPEAKKIDPYREQF